MKISQVITPVLLGIAGAGLVAGCQFSVPNAASVCSGGKCATVSAIPSGQHSSPPEQVTTTAPAAASTNPDSTVTVTATPSVTPSTVVAGCSVYLTHDELYQLATSVQARNDLAICMQIPGASDTPQGSQAVSFENQLAIVALAALNSGDYHGFPAKLSDLQQQYS